LIEKFDQLIRSSEIRSSDPLSDQRNNDTIKTFSEAHTFQ
jgi:hypothetical protein